MRGPPQPLRPLTAASSPTTPPTPSPFTSWRPTPSSWPGSRSQTHSRSPPATPLATSAFTRCPRQARTCTPGSPEIRSRWCATPTSTSGLTRLSPDGYPAQIVFRHASQAAELTDVERGTADFALDGVPPERPQRAQTQFANRLYVNPSIGQTTDLLLNTRVAPFTDVRVRRALNYAIDRDRDRAPFGQDGQPICQVLRSHPRGYRPYCPYTLDPNTSGIWHAPDLAQAERLIDASHTRGTPITIWALAGGNFDANTIVPYIVSLLDRLGYPTTVKEFRQRPVRAESVR